MGQRITFDYFYGAEADQYCFYRIPKLLFLNDVFKELSSDAKILYGLLLDRMSLSVKNQWLDEENRAYIYYSIEEVMEMLNCGRNKAIKSMQELDAETGMGLIEKKRQGMGKSNMIYVKTFLIQEEAEIVTEEIEQEFTNQTFEQKEENAEVYKSNFKKFKKQTSRSLKNKLQEVPKINFKKFTFQTQVILTVVILNIIIYINLIISYQKMRKEMMRMIHTRLISRLSRRISA